MPEQVVLSSVGPSVLSCSTDVTCEGLGNSSSGSPSLLGSNDGHGPSLHVHKGMATEGNGLHVTRHNRSEETETTRLFRISGVRVGDLQNELRGCNMHGVHRPRDTCSLLSFTVEPGSFMKEIIGCLQSGHGMDPGGPTISEGMLLVEQR